MLMQTTSHLDAEGENTPLGLVAMARDTPARAGRGRKPGVKTVASSLEARRRDWLAQLTASKGAKIRLCQQLAAPDSFVSHLLAGRRTFTDAIARRIELVVGVASGTADRGAVTEAPAQPRSLLDKQLAQVLRSQFKKAMADGRIDNVKAASLISLLL